ncbi:MAG TPA: hypothetical protein ENN97_04020 [Phycisphaerales bacterium]|nr:hypothetical protein [Phycisphaerales bacterium]
MKQKRYYYHYIICGCIAAAAATTRASDPNAVLDQSRTLRRQFMAHTLSAVSEKTPDEKEATLAELIEQVLSLQAPQTKDPNQPSPSSSVADEDPNSKPLEQKTSAPSSAKQTTEQQTDAATKQRNHWIEWLSTIEDPESIPHPKELADVLYRAGRLESAARYYDIALSQTSKEQAPTYSWLLFQSANCVRRTDAAKAKTRYEELVQLYPNSVWAAAAQGRLQMLNWLETNQTQVQQYTTLRSENE